MNPVKRVMRSNLWSEKEKKMPEKEIGTSKRHLKDKYIFFQKQSPFSQKKIQLLNIFTKKLYTRAAEIYIVRRNFYFRSPTQSVMKFVSELRMCQFFLLTLMAGITKKRSWFIRSNDYYYYNVNQGVGVRHAVH